MSAKLDQSLDSIITSNKPDRRPRNSGPNRGNDNRGNRRPGNNNNHPYQRNQGGGGNSSTNRGMPVGGMADFAQLQALAALQAQAAAAAQAASTAASAPVAAAPSKIIGNTIHITNLDKDVTSDDLKDIFEKVGTVKSSQVNYNQNGQSLGTADIKFQSNKHAEQAVQEYDGAEVDGKPMYLKLVGNIVNPSPAVVKKQQQQLPATLPLPLAMLPQLAALTRGLPLNGNHRDNGNDRRDRDNSRPRRDSNNNNRDNNNRDRDNNRRGNDNNNRGGQRRDGGGNQQRGRDRKDKDPSQADLDAELDSYHSQKEKKGE